jgi:hypothetical protein
MDRISGVTSPSKGAGGGSGVANPMRIKKNDIRGIDILLSTTSLCRHGFRHG